MREGIGVSRHRLAVDSTSRYPFSCPGAMFTCPSDVERGGYSYEAKQLMRVLFNEWLDVDYGTTARPRS